MRFFDLFKSVRTFPLPDYPAIAAEAIPPCSSVLFYGGNKLTELAGNRLFKYAYNPPAFHAAFYIENGLFLNVGKFRTLETLESEQRSTRRIDIIIYKTMAIDQVKTLKKLAYLDTSHPKVGLSLPDYAWSDYLRFGLQFLKPSKKEFCSENVVDLFNAAAVWVSGKPAVDTAPWDLHTFALEHPELCEIRTYFIGPDFGK